MKAVCYECHREMQVEKLGQRIRIHPNDPNIIILGDVYRCSTCGRAVVINFGHQHRDEQQDEDAIELEG